MSIRGPCDAGQVQGALAPVQSLTAARKRWVLIATVLGSSLTFIDGSALGVALPAIQRDLGAGPAAVQWISNAYLLTLGALVLIGGAAGDRFGRRRVFLIGVGVFALASMVCGLAPTVEVLIGGRALQGIGAALLTPGALALIGSAFPPEERGKAFGAWAGAGALFGMVGPLVGGWLSDHADWRFIFWINVPLAALTMVVAWRAIPESRDVNARGLDWRGALLAMTGLAALTWSLTAAPDRGWGDRAVIIGLVYGGAALAGFLLVEIRERYPMMPLALFRSSVFSGMNLLTLLLYFALGGAMFFLPFDLIRVQGFSATMAGAAMLPFAVIMGLFSGLAGRLADRFGARLSLAFGPALAGIGLCLLALPRPGAGYVDGPLAGMTVLAIGMTLAVGPLTAAVMGAVEPARAGVASGVNNAVARIAGLLAVALLGALVSSVFVDRVDEPDARMVFGEVMAGGSVHSGAVEAFHASFRVVMLACAACAVAAGIVGGLTGPKRR
ncbi:MULTISPECIES: DHA2 family efflux MFS transporter permease subunit [unclassified Brevundimonas]|uniref:DHA2 family efflux MFS transporter permease subunit n=1 Tax=unclassified Brevundimonas TaxID=2622653 RepID=UPI000CFCE21B|nr:MULTISPECIES: DHA2 family efflux MFS transporter permease subunit [unclassified Brevundimonas]PRA27641.1 MFS transporter [Brevundimonas sp. MYb27]PQZ84406.1 MFS transporter [Brevundimonas sp. MYb31]PRB17640.1 MFS transporter [Brevundimonas sp. MYb52]PRB38012.1 MFS transporter [Brevundimonas sp. MYb46]PRB41997.1 MFS transporter [Brevundimonas sp. MYb33]